VGDRRIAAADRDSSIDSGMAHGRRDIDDTTADARRVLDARLAAMSDTEKVASMRAITLTVNTLALAGLRARHPTASQGELLLELARLRLGDVVVRRVYGDTSA
jgi:hypothetical protein